MIQTDEQTFMTSPTIKTATMRPKFDLRAKCEPNQVLLKVKGHLDEGQSRVTGKVFPSSAVLKMHPEDVHFWSPQLQLSVEPFLPSGSIVHALIGPRPTIWSFFVASYCFFSFAGVMGLIFGYSQVSLGQDGAAFWSAPISLAGIIVTYGFARLGRRLAAQQSASLYDVVEKVIADC